MRSVMKESSATKLLVITLEKTSNTGILKLTTVYKTAARISKKNVLIKKYSAHVLHIVKYNFSVFV